MPSFSPPEVDTDPIKLGYIGHSSVGKTGSIAALIAMGYHTIVLDYDGDCRRILEGYLFDPNSPYRQPRKGLWDADSLSEGLENSCFIDLTEQRIIQGTKAIPQGQTWVRTMQLLNNITDGNHKYGGITTLNSKHVIVFDSGSRFFESAMNYHLAINGRADKGPRVGRTSDNDYTQVYQMILGFLDMLKSREIKCNIIMVFHITYVEEGQQTAAVQFKKGFPQSVGPKISPMIPQYFNHMIRARSDGNYPSTKRCIVTANDDNVELKTTAPLRIPREYDLTSGLAEYFRDIKRPPQGA